MRCHVHQPMVDRFQQRYFYVANRIRAGIGLVLIYLCKQQQDNTYFCDSKITVSRLIDPIYVIREL